MSKTLFQLLLSSRAPAMAHRGNLDARSVFPEVVGAQTRFFHGSSHHFATQVSMASQNRFEVLFGLFVSLLGFNSLFLGPSRSDLHTLSFMLLTAASNNLEVFDFCEPWSSFLIVVFLVGF